MLLNEIYTILLKFHIGKGIRLNKRTFLFIFLSVFLLGACEANTKKEEPQTAAYQDEFTRQFITSQEETEEGYYTFKSITDGYTMLFPVNAIMDGSYYQKRFSEFEIFQIGEINEKENHSYFIIGDYYDRGATWRIDANLSILIGSEQSLTPESFEKYTVGKNDVYYAEFRDDINENENGYYWVFLCYVKDQESDKALSLTYNSTCLSETEKCNLNVDEERERAKKIFHSVRFINQDE